MGVCSVPEEGRLAQGGRVSVSVVGSGHREAQLRPQALRGMLAPPVRGGRSQQPPDTLTLCPPHRGCGGLPWAPPDHLGLGPGLCSPSLLSDL